MKRVAALQQVSDWSDFVRGHCLRELLDQRRPSEAPGRIVVSPDRHHLLLLWNQPASQARVVAFQRLGTVGADLERSWQPPQPPVVGLLFLEGCAAAAAAFWVLAVVWEQGRTELWRFVPAAGWCLLQSLELCCGARARIVSICNRGNRLVWCEERPPLNAQLTPEKRAFRYCICTRELQIGEKGAQLSPLRIVLHNSPAYEVLASTSGVFLVPTPATFSGVAKCVLIWRPENTDIVVAVPSRGCICTKALHPGNEVDFKKLVLGYVGILASMEVLDIHSCTLSSSKGILLATSSGTVDLVQPNGLWRSVFDFGQSALTPGKEIQLKVSGDMLVCLLGCILYLVDLNSRQLLEKKLLSTEMFFLDFPTEEEEAVAVQLLAPNGIYHLDLSGTDKDCQPEPTLVEMVFEEACKYYQRRSLSSSKLTVEKLKKGGMFQAPIALSSILCHSLASKDKRTGALPEPYAKLLGTMQLELQSFQSLEFLKSCVVRASESEVDSYSEELVDQEFSRLLCLDLNRENLAYMNAIFGSFPVASWKAIQNHLQLQQNGDGLLVARATPDVWKKILGGPVPGLCKQEVSLNGVVPLFELICLSLHQFKPKWLPSFVELSQQYVGTSWAYNKEGPECGMPLYKRALAVLTRRSNCSVAYTEIEIELLLCSHRPKAILQAIHLLIRHRRWQRVMDVAEKFSKLSPLLNKEIFIILLGEFAQHRALDPYLDTLWELCPADLSAPDILSIIQQHLPQTEFDPPPFLPDGAPQLTVSLLKPLLHRVAHCAAGQDEIYADVLQGPAFPPPTPPRHQQVASKAAAQEYVQRTEPLQNHTQGTLFEGV
ncbi:BLOC-2 complex member HPS6 [Eublepharis macularius]|uniref:BLOC-2 complex member HPS6 n=1 Tax=Eublepharis macularius TaxID=481883 RepID=A0AA97L2G2_EUBMA|nr:BLOC-2 complex member HPS6 [Eublepharis macularius]